jgi:hypothetical protein
MTDQPAADAQQDPTIIISLSDEQIAFLLELMNIRSIPGFDIPESFNDEVAHAAQNALLAQGILGYDDEDKLVINQGVAEVITASVRSHSYMTVTWDDKLHAFHIADAYSVYLNSPLPGVQRFQVLDSGLKLAAVIMVLTQMDEPQANVAAMAPQPLDIAAYQEARQLADAGQLDAARAALSTTGLSEAVVDGVIAPAHRIVVRTTQIIDDRFENARAFAIHMDAQNAYYLIEEHSNTLTVATMNGEAVLTEIADNITPRPVT